MQPKRGYFPLFDPRTGRQIADAEFEQDLVKAAMATLSKLPLDPRLATETPSRQPHSRATLESLILPQSITSLFTSESPELSLANRVKTEACNLGSLSQKMALLSYKREVTSRRREYISSLAGPLPSSCPVKKLRRLDLLPQIQPLDVSLKETNEQTQRLLESMEECISSFTELHQTCSHLITIHKSVSAELQQAGVFTAATKKLIMVDILTELHSRISSCVFPNSTLASALLDTNRASQTWDAFLQQSRAMREKQAALYASTQRVLNRLSSGLPPSSHPVAELPDKTSESDSNDLSTSQTSFQLASPASVGSGAGRVCSSHNKRHGTNENRSESMDSSEELFVKGTMKKRKVDFKGGAQKLDESTGSHVLQSDPASDSASKILSTPLKQVIRNSVQILVKDSEEMDPDGIVQSGQSHSSSQESRTTAGSAHKVTEMQSVVIRPVSLVSSSPIGPSSSQDFQESAFSEIQGSVVDAASINAHANLEDSEVAPSAESCVSSTVAQAGSS
ncbi:hypothetical protein HDU81_010176 [Chytriomyces hyalinus]|nr:hypothetical protein HDU81_010176 [Chytriomyces hyalinus]